MAIYSRRILQQLINENAGFLPRKQIKKHVFELNRMHETLSLAFEWEVVLLNAFSKVVRPDSFSLDVEANHGELYRGGPRARLKLPPPSRFAQVIFNADFTHFLEEISLAPKAPRKLRIYKAEDDVDLTIGYDPTACCRAAGGSLTAEIRWGRRSSSRACSVWLHRLRALHDLPSLKSIFATQPFLRHNPQERIAPFGEGVVADRRQVCRGLSWG